MKKLVQILTDLEQGKINSDDAEKQVLDLFAVRCSLFPDIRDEMDADMQESGMAQGEIESCLTHWNNKYIIQRKY